MMVGCGYSQRDVEVTGQVKRIVSNTPLICSDFMEVDLSLGIIRGGVGSMSTQDMEILINKEQADILKTTEDTGNLVKIKYDEQRINFCSDMRQATQVTILK